MGRLHRDRLGRKCATLAAVLAVVFACDWVATGFSGGLTFALAVGAATAVAVFGDTRSACSLPFLRRRD